MLASILFALAGCGFTCLMTVAGSALVFFVKSERAGEMNRLFLGFASGVMLAASIWSLILPSFERAEQLNIIPWLPAAVGFLLGGILFYFLDGFIEKWQEKRRLSLRVQTAEAIGQHGMSMMMLAITLHNIPEGMAVGLACALAVAQNTEGAILAAAALAFGIGVQNFPEGAAISLPLRMYGTSRKKAFFYGALSGIAEPIAGVLTVLAAGKIEGLMPWLLSFAAGVMVFVVVEELIPETHSRGKNRLGTLGVMIGFLLMMVLDVTLG